MNRLLPLLALLLVLSPALAQDQYPNAIKIGDVNYSLLGMGFKPAINGTVIETGEGQLEFTLNMTGGLSIAAFMNVITVTVTTPKNTTFKVQNISHFAVVLDDPGNYTIDIKWGPWVPLVGGLCASFTGSGSYRLTVIKNSPFPILQVATVVAGISAAIVVAVVLGRRHKGKIWLK